MKSLFNQQLQVFPESNVKISIINQGRAAWTRAYFSALSNCFVSGFLGFFYKRQTKPPVLPLLYKDALSMVTVNMVQQKRAEPQKPQRDFVRYPMHSTTLHGTANGHSYGKINGPSFAKLVSTAEPGDCIDTDPLAPFDYINFLRKEGLI